MNIYCPHCGKKNTTDQKNCAGCRGNLHSLGTVSAPVTTTFTPVIVHPLDKSSSIATTRSEWEARRAARKSVVSEDPVLTAGAPALAGTNSDDDEGVQVFNAGAFSGKLTFSSETIGEDGKKEPLQFALNMPKTSSAKTPSPAPKRGRPAGSKNKK